MASSAVLQFHDALELEAFVALGTVRRKVHGRTRLDERADEVQWQLCMNRHYAKTDAEYLAKRRDAIRRELAEELDCSYKAAEYKYYADRKKLMKYFSVRPR